MGHEKLGRRHPVPCTLLLFSDNIFRTFLKEVLPQVVRDVYQASTSVCTLH